MAYASLFFPIQIVLPLVLPKFEFLFIILFIALNCCYAVYFILLLILIYPSRSAYEPIRIAGAIIHLYLSPDCDPTNSVSIFRSMHQQISPFFGSFDLFSVFILGIFCCLRSFGITGPLLLLIIVATVLLLLQLFRDIHYFNCACVSFCSWLQSYVVYVDTLYVLINHSVFFFSLLFKHFELGTEIINWPILPQDCRTLKIVKLNGCKYLFLLYL